MGRTRCGRLGAGAATVLLACAATALASGPVNYSSHNRTKPPYLSMTVGNGKVTKVRWDIYEVCPAIGNSFQKSSNVLNVRIKNGHFSKRVVYQIFGPSPLATIDVTTTITGTITGKTAVATVRDTRKNFANGTCSGSHRFSLHEVGD